MTKIILSVLAMMILNQAAHATCNTKEQRAVEAGQSMATLNGLSKVQVYEPVADKKHYGQFLVEIEGARNGFHAQLNYNITVSDGDFCDIVKIEKASTPE